MSLSESRPRRSTRVPAKSPTVVASQEAALTSKKKKPKDEEAELEYLLTNPKSKLTTTNISDLINYENFLNLSEASQRTLCEILPATAFQTYQNYVHPAHSANLPDGPSDSPKESSSPAIERSPATLDPIFFTNPFFLSAAHTFQDHIFSGWLTAKQHEKISEFERGTIQGEMHARWKDEEWEQLHGVSKRRPTHDLDLVALARGGQVREGDILVYRRRFPSLAIHVEKELLVRKVKTQSFALELLLQPGTIFNLPPYLLQIAPEEPKPPILTMESILSSADLEGGILDVDGRVSREALLDFERQASSSSPLLHVDFAGVASKSASPSRAAKSLSVWRWHEDRVPDIEVQQILPRGGREYCGTVHYLRRA